MTGFEPVFFAVGSNRSPNCAVTTDQYSFIVSFSMEDNKSFSTIVVLDSLGEGFNSWGNNKEKELIDLGLEGWEFESKFLI